MVILPLFVLLLLPFAVADGPWLLCDNSSNYTSNSTFKEILTLLSSTLPEKAASSATLFATDTLGAAPDTVFALAFCRGDVEASTCGGCVANAFQDGPRNCPNNKDVSTYYDACMLRFSNKNFLNNISDASAILLISNQKFTTNASMQLLLFTLLTSTAQSATGSEARFMTSRLDIRSLPTLYCLMQCRPDLAADECVVCFQRAIEAFDGSRGGRVFGAWCIVRYEIYPFFQGDPMMRIITAPGSAPVTVYSSPSVAPAAAPPPELHGAAAPPPKHHGRNSRRRPLWIIAVVTPLLSILLCFICSVVWTRRRRRKGKADMLTSRPEEYALAWRLEEKSSEFTLFEFSEILQATSNFSKDNLLGQGGFGPVYKGLLPDGIDIAVKRLASHSGQGFIEFRNEIELIAKLQHNNLVKLLGCCIEGEEKILVYEYLPNKSLDFFIFDINRTTLVDWNKRRVIIEGISQGLLYLHKHSRLRIIHRDLKASNILLDEEMKPKISDFGLAKIFGSSDTQGNTKRVVGTYGYMSPEYASEGIYSVKSDVFSFGVLLLEILSGRRNSGFHHNEDFLNLLGYSWKLWEGARWFEILEESIAKEIHTTEARKYINIALMCVQESADDRPTMSDVVAMLNNESAILPQPNHPAYYNLRVSRVDESVSVVVPCSNNDVTITAEPDGR